MATMETEQKAQRDQGNKTLLHILHMADPTLPIGGFSHSNGLETYVQQGIVKDVHSVHLFAKHMLQYNYKYNDGLFVRFAHEAATKRSMHAVLTLDQKCTAVKSPRETREGGQKLGARFLKLYLNLIEDPLLQSYYNLLQNKEAPGQYPIAYGLVSALLDIPLPQALGSFYYNAAISMVTNAVKLVPLGQLDGQKIIYDLLPILDEAVQETLDLGEEMLGVCNPGFDIKCMQHERLYSRLYMS